MNEEQLQTVLWYSSLFSQAVLQVKHGMIPEDSCAYQRLVTAAESGDPRLRDIANNLANGIYSMQFP